MSFLVTSSFPPPGRQAVNRLLRRRGWNPPAGPAGRAPKQYGLRYSLNVRGNSSVLANGSEPYWAGSQLSPRPIGVRLLVSRQSGVPAPRRSGFVWALRGGPGCRGPGGASLAGEGAGSPARREVRGSAWSAGPGPAPFSAPRGPEPPWNPTPPRPSPGVPPAAPPLLWPRLLPATPCLPTLPRV